jgi:chromosome segregation ATPase
MARKAVATAETVAEAVEALFTEGLDPTVERVRAKLGGGSFTTISKLLSEALAQRQTQATQVSEVPSDLVEIGQRAVASIYAAVQRQATAKIELIEADAHKQIDAANHARAEAALEIERLEREGEQAAEGLVAAQKATQDAIARAERGEATAQASREEIKHLTQVLAGAQADAQAARESEREAQQRAARSEDARRAAEVESRKETDRLQTALARAEAQAEAGRVEIERLTQRLTVTEAEAKRATQAHQVAEATSRKAIDQLQQQVGKLEASDGALQRELQKAQQEADRAHENERRARDEAAEFRGQLKALTEKGTK